MWWWPSLWWLMRPRNVQRLTCTGVIPEPVGNRLAQTRLEYSPAQGMAPSWKAEYLCDCLGWANQKMTDKNHGC